MATFIIEAQLQLMKNRQNPIPMRALGRTFKDTLDCM